MQEFLSKMIGRKLDVLCHGPSSLRGEAIKVESGVLQLKDEKGQTCYIAIDKIAVVWEARDDDDHRAGFVPDTLIK